MPATILIVDDDHSLRWLLYQMLGHLGLESDSASNGQEALERIKKWRYQLIFMDINMPNMDGYEATRLIRAAESENGKPDSLSIVALTSDTCETQCRAAGMNAYLQKPVTLTRVTAVITEVRPHLLAKKKGRRQSQ